MFNAASLLGSFLQQRSAPSAGHRLGNAMDQGSHQAGSLSGLLSNFGGGGGALSGLMGAFSGQGRDADADMQRFKDQARSAVTSPGQAIAGNNPLAIGGLGALAGTLLGGGRGAVGGGLLAILGSLAFDALRPGAQAAGPATPGLAPTGPAGSSGGYGRPDGAPMTEADVQQSALLLLRSMIQAAKADGQVDGAEIERITSKIEAGDPSEAAEARAFVFDQMRGPPDLAGLVRDVRTPVEAAAVYGAALMAIEVDTAAEREYLAKLARDMGLDHATVARLHGSLGVAAPV